MNTHVVVVSDTHAGSRYGLCMPETLLVDPIAEEPIKVKLNPVQTNMAKWWKEDVKAVTEMIGPKDKIILVHNGDATQGTRFATELMSTSIADHVEIAYANMLPWLETKRVSHLYMVAGTDVHEAGESSATKLLCNMLARKAGDSHVSAHQHLLLKMGKELFDISHHGPNGGSRIWLKGNVLRLYTQSLLDAEILARRNPPTVILRGHFHRFVPEHVERHGHYCRAAILPSWQFPGIWTRKATQSANSAQFGTNVFLFHQGKIHEWRRLMREVDLRREVVVDVSSEA